MFKKNVMFGIGILVGVLSIVGVAIPIQKSAWALTILCNVPTCVGTNSGDTMAAYGSYSTKDIFGCGGNDVLQGGLGNDRIVGDSLLNCPDGGVPGADRINGGPGDDVIVHGNSFSTASDGHTDYIDCGPGNDEVFINHVTDHDIALNCEIIHEG